MYLDTILSGSSILSLSNKLLMENKKDYKLRRFHLMECSLASFDS
jgi:hypothetical protein